MKSVTIWQRGKLLIKVIQRKSGYEIETTKAVENDPGIEIEVRDDRNCKVHFDGGKAK